VAGGWGRAVTAIDAGLESDFCVREGVEEKGSSGSEGEREERADPGEGGFPGGAGRCRDPMARSTIMHDKEF
jgi:hypothetical protein